MLVDEPINRFASNFGRTPNSISLQADWTSGAKAENVEVAGPTFDREDDFGDGLTGLGDLTSAAHSVFDIGSIVLWPVAIYGVYAIITTLTKGEQAVKRKTAIKKAKRDLIEAKKLSRF